MNSPLDTGTRLNIHKNLNVLCMFHLDPVLIGNHSLKKKKKKKKDSFLIPLSLNLLVGAGQEYFFNLSMI